jgi:ABC-3C biological conflict system middle component
MTPWSQRSLEERALLNPGFCASLLWHAALGYTDTGNGSLSFEEAFLILPFVLHRKTREALPRNTRTSLAVWLDNNPLARGQVVTRARLLVIFTKEGMLFGGMHGFIRIEEGWVHANEAWKQTVNRTLKETSEEVRECTKKAEFLGKWFAQAGNAQTILALMGVRP